MRYDSSWCLSHFIELTESMATCQRWLIACLRYAEQHCAICWFCVCHWAPLISFCECCGRYWFHFMEQFQSTFEFYQWARVDFVVHSLSLATITERWLDKTPFGQICKPWALACLKLLSRNLVWWGRSKPGCQIVGLVTIVWLTTETVEVLSPLHSCVDRWQKQTIRHNKNRIYSNTKQKYFEDCPQGIRPGKNADKMKQKDETELFAATEKSSS